MHWGNKKGSVATFRLTKRARAQRCESHGWAPATAGIKHRRKRPRQPLQLKPLARRRRTDSMCGGMASALLAVTARRGRVAERARTGGGSHDDLALSQRYGSELSSGCAA